MVGEICLIRLIVFNLLPDIICIVKLRRMRRAEIVASFEKVTNAYKILVVKPAAKRPIGGSKCTLRISTNMRSTVFWDITPCSPLKVTRRFGGTYIESRWQAEQSVFLGLFFDPEHGGDMFYRNVG
jgi:hypothetical protein